jgi:hypothetical protein
MWFIIIALLAFYFAGSWYNRRRGRALGRWIQTGLGVFGGRPAWKALGAISAGAQVNITDALRPLRRVELQYALLTREFPPLWAVEWFRGKRDLLIIRGWSTNRPATEFDVIPSVGALRRRLDAESPLPVEWRDMAAGLGLATTAPLDARLTAALERFLSGCGPAVERLSLRQREPHLVLFLRLGTLENAPSADLFKAMRQLVAAFTSPGRDNGR